MRSSYLLPIIAISPQLLPASRAPKDTNAFGQVSEGGHDTCSVRVGGTLDCAGYNVNGLAHPTGTFTQVN